MIYGPASTSNSTAGLADLFSVASIQIPSCVFRFWRQDDIFPIAGFYTYLAGVDICIQLRGLLPFPSIVTHRRLANLDSLVDNHTLDLFGLGSLAWAGHLVHIAHPLQVLSSDGVHHEYVPEREAHFAGLQST